MNKDDVTMIGFEIVAFAGDARSKLYVIKKLNSSISKGFSTPCCKVEDKLKITIFCKYV